MRMRRGRMVRATLLHMRWMGGMPAEASLQTRASREWSPTYRSGPPSIDVTGSGGGGATRG